MPTPPEPGRDLGAELEAARRALVETEARLVEREVWLSAQSDAFQAAINEAPLHVSLGILVDTVVRQADDGRRCAFYLANDRGDRLSHVVGMPDSHAAADGFVISPESLARDLAVATGRPAATTDVGEEPPAAAHGYRGCWSFPIETATGRLAGAFAFYFPEPRDPTPHDREVAAAITHAAAIIISRHHEDARLREREADLARVQRIAGVGGIDVDVTAGMRSRRSPEYLRLHGLAPDTADETEEQWLARVHPEDRRQARSTLSEAIDGTSRFYESEYRIIRPSDGAVRWIHARADIERDASGKARRLVGAHVDVTDQKRVQDELRQSEERLRMTLEAGRMGTWRFDLATGQQQWSERQFRLFGLTPGTTAPTRALFLSMVHPEDRPKVEFDAGDLLPGRGILDAEFRIIRPDGQIRWLVAHTVVRRDGAGNALELIGLNWDITERKHAEAALRESEEGLRIALEAGRMGTYRFDVKTGIEQWSDAEYELLGLTRTDGPPTRELFLSIVHPDDLHLVQYTEDDRRPEGTALDSEFRIIRPDTGEVRTITAHALARFGPDGKPAELIGVNQDVTEERRARAALRASEERLQQFSDASSDVLWIREAPSLQWEYLSPAFDKIYGLSRQDALRGDNYRSWLDLILPEDRAVAEAGIERIRSGDRAAFQYRIRRPDGQVRWLRDTDFPMRNDAGTVTHIGGVGSDITGLKQAEEHQRMLLAELQHRVRNTLAVIRAIARRTARTSDSVEDFAMNLEGRIDAFSRVQAEVTRDPISGVDLAVMIAEELRAASAREGENLTIDGPPVRLRPKAAETIALGMHELATNAIKHGALTGERGQIRISWSLVDGQPLHFVWKESGIVLDPSAPRRRGLGTEVLTQTIPYELSATAAIDLEPDGLRYVLSLPQSALAGGPLADSPPA